MFTLSFDAKLSSIKACTNVLVSAVIVTVLVVSAIILADNAVSVLITEFITTAFFVIIILGCTTHKASRKFAPIAAGLALTLIHLISIPISNTSVNPARSTGQVFFAEGGNYTGQLWLFWLAPITGAIVAGLVCKLSKKA